MCDKKNKSTVLQMVKAFFTEKRNIDNAAKLVEHRFDEYKTQLDSNLQAKDHEDTQERENNLKEILRRIEENHAAIQSQVSFIVDEKTKDLLKKYGKEE